MTNSRGGKQKEPENVATQLTALFKDSANFYQKCKKPDYNEYMKILQAFMMGFIVMGVIGYFIKLVFIPINNIILSWTSPIRNRTTSRLKSHLSLNEDVYTTVIAYLHERLVRSH